MAWTLTGDLNDYFAAAGDFLLAHPVSNTIQLGALETLRINGNSAYGDVSPLFGWWRSSADGAVESAFLVTPPYPVLLSQMPEQPARLLAEELAARKRQLAGVNSEQETAEIFAAAWGELTGAESKVHRRSRLFQLGRLAPPVLWPPGYARVATAEDWGLLEKWFEEFGLEVNELGHFTRVIDDRLSYGGMTLWEIAGAPVAMAGITRTVAGIARVGPVYTPPDQRRHGYAGAATVTVTRAALDSGAAHVVLFTDLANPTSNALYQRLGYRAVEDSVVLSFTAESLTLESPTAPETQQ
jgi:RimJ/RimL family protein N-acetyltransferase